MRTHDGYDARDSYECVRDAMGENVQVGNDDIDTNGRRFQETSTDIAATMRSLIKAQEEQHQLNASMLKNLTDIQRWMRSGRHIEKPEGNKSSARRRKRYSSGFSDSKESIGESGSSSHGEKRRRHYRNNSRDDFNKASLLTFNGEIKNYQEA